MNEFPDDFGNGPGADQVVDHGLAGTLLEDPLCDEGGGERPRDDLRLLGYEEHAIGIAVERDAELAPVLDDRALQVGEVLGLDRVGLVVGEVAVQLEVERDDL